MESDGLVTASNEGDSWCRQRPLHRNDLIWCDLEIFHLFSHRVGPVSSQSPHYKVIGHTLFESQQSADNQAGDQSSGGKFDLSESFNHFNRRGNLNASSGP